MKVFINCYWFDIDKLMKELSHFENTKILKHNSLISGEVNVKVESTDEWFPEYIEKMMKNDPLRKVIVA